jgi:hypothetical protein
VLLVVLMFAAAPSSQAAMVGRISEILTGPYAFSAAPMPAYVEFFQFGATGPFDLVVLDALPDRLRRVRSVTTIHPVEDVQTHVVHAGAWDPATLPLGDVVSGATNMGLGESFGSARTIALYSRATGFVPNTRPTDAALLDGLLDAVTYSLKSIPAVALQGEGVLAGLFGHAFRRSVEGGNYIDQWTIGPVLDDEWQLTSTARLDPGLFNLPLPAENPGGEQLPDPDSEPRGAPSASMPEPTAGVVWLATAMVGGSVRRRVRG